MIAKNAMELGKILSEQARQSGYVKAAIVILLDFDDVLHKSEYGFNQNVVAPVPTPAPVLEISPSTTPQDAEKKAE